MTEDEIKLATALEQLKHVIEDVKTHEEEIEKIKDFDSRLLGAIQTIKTIVWIAGAVVALSQAYQLVKAW